MQSNKQFFSFYYENNEINLNHLNNDNSMSAGFIAVVGIFVAVTVGLGGYVLWTFFRIKKLENNSVEMTNFN